MSYKCRVTGVITITPPLNWAQTRKVQEVTSARRIPLLALHVDTEAAHTDECEILTHTCQTLTGAYDYEHSTYGIDECLQQVMDLCPGHAFTGYLEGSGEEGVWRLGVIDGKAARVTPELTWPQEVQ